MTTTPNDTTELAGTSVTLRCTTDRPGSPGRILWRRNPGIITAAGDRLVEYNCQANAAFPQYSVVSSSDGQCDLVINNASLALAANYLCGDTDSVTAHAELTVIGELCVCVLAAAHNVGQQAAA